MGRRRKDFNKKTGKLKICKDCHVPKDEIEFPVIQSKFKLVSGVVKTNSSIGPRCHQCLSQARKMWAFNRQVEAARKMPAFMQFNGFVLINLSRNSTRCFVCLETVFRGAHQRVWKSANDNHVCWQCVDAWAVEGGELGKISRSKIQGGYDISVNQKTNNQIVPL